MPEIVDAHQHFWQLNKGFYGWLTPELPAIYRDFLPEDLAPHLARFGVSRTVLVQAAETEAETDFLLDLAEKTPWIAGVVGWLDITAEEFPDRLSVYRGRPKWVGVRPMFQEHDPEMILRPVVRENIAHVARAGVPFDILTYPHHLPNMLTALAQAPDLKAVIDHLSKPRIRSGEFDGWAADMERLAAFPNLACKLSGIITEASADWSLETIRPYVAHVARLFGPGRLIFGSDWPVCTLAGTYGEVTALARTLMSEFFGPEENSQIFGGNAQRFYGL